MAIKLGTFSPYSNQPSKNIARDLFKELFPCAIPNVGFFFESAHSLAFHVEWWKWEAKCCEGYILYTEYFFVVFTDILYGVEEYNLEVVGFFSFILFSNYFGSEKYCSVVYLNLVRKLFLFQISKKITLTQLCNQVS